MRLRILAALGLAAPLASAQAQGDGRTFAGCDVFACVTFTARYATGTLGGQPVDTVTGNGTFTLRSPIVSGAYGSLGYFETLGGPLFDGQYYSGSRYLTNVISLVGRAAGDVIPFSVTTSIGPTLPVLDVRSFSTALVSPSGQASGDRVNITLAAVPEPSTLALAGAGLLAVGGVTVRRRRATTA